MHTLFTAFFACLFGFSHAAATPAAAPPSTASRYAAPHESPATRAELTQQRVHSGYAEVSCVSCRRIDVTYRTR